MTTAEALDELTCSHPPVLHLNGKTSTGKSTFAAVLQERLGYAIIDLDQIMYDDVISRFHLEDQAGDVFVAV